MNTLESLFTEAVHDVMVSDKFSKPVVAQYTKNQEQGWGGIYTLTIDGVAHRGVYAEKMEYFADVLDRIQHELDIVHQRSIPFFLHKHRGEQHRQL
jgi:hypothetical protein